MKYSLHFNRIIILSSLFLCFGFLQAEGMANITTPEKHFGFTPGSDGNLFLYEDLIKYLEKLDVESPKLMLKKIGKSTLGKDMYIAFISSIENIANLDKLKDINSKLALDAALTEKERQQFFQDGKVFFVATLSMHSSEVGPSQSAPIIAHKLVSSNNSEIEDWLEDVVYMMVPCHNPDGMNMIVNHFNEYKGTKYDGSSLPGVYHKYIGHNVNRDFVTLSQLETKAIANIFSKDWFPQVMVEKHQMGSYGPRYFVPPMHDPIAENVDETLWNWTWVFGSNMITDMTKIGQAGVSQHYLFDDYWPGSTETCIWKGVIGMLTEAASAYYGNPRFVEPNELKVYGKGLSEYKKSINMPLPWEGGWWRLGDIVDYEISSTLSIIKTSSLHRKDILEFRNDLCRKEVKKGKTKPPYYYIIPRKQHDESTFVNLVNLLREHGVSVYNLKEDIIVFDTMLKKDDIVVPLAQPFRAFIKEVLEKQKFPTRHYTPGGKLIKPYDITSWSLPLHKNVTSIEISRGISKELESNLEEITTTYSLRKDTPNNYWAVIFSANNNESYKAAFHANSIGLKLHRIEQNIELDGVEIPKGSFVIKVKTNKTKLQNVIDQLKIQPIYIEDKIDYKSNELLIPRIAVVESFFHDMDAGWVRFLFDNYFLPYEIVNPRDFKNTNFKKDFDVVIFPDENKSVLMDGKYKSEDEKYSISSIPPNFSKGIGEDGFKNLMDFINEDGIIISWGGSAELFTGILKINHSDEDIEEFQLPYKDISNNLSKNGLYCPGSFLSVNILPDHPITYGLPDEIGVFSRGKPIFATSFPSFDTDRRVIGKFPEENILLSGYCDGEEMLANKSSIIWLKKGRGQFVLFGFSPHFRGSTDGTFKLIFNSILLPKI